MFSRATKIRLALFLIIAVVGTGYTGSRYVGLDQVFGAEGYRVSVDMPESGGLFTNSEVTYRGVAVGRVTAIDLTGTGVRARVYVEPEAPPIPADTRAVVANRSAVGEQFLDLRPATEKPPYLQDGAVIPGGRVELPPKPESLLVNLDRLVRDVPNDSLRTVVDELGTAFEGSGEDLQKLLDNGAPLLEAADRHLPQTTGLLANSDVVLRTQEQQDDDIRSLSSGLRDIAGQLRDSDGDLRTVIRDAPGASDELNRLVLEVGPDFGAVTANMLTTSRLMGLRGDAIEQLLVSLPVVSAFSHNLSPDGTGHLGVVLNFGNPPNCTEGYEGTTRRPGSDVTDIPVDQNLGCTEPRGSETGVRGSQNVPREPVPEPVPFPDLNMPR